MVNFGGREIVDDGSYDAVGIGKPMPRVVTETMIQAACVAAYGVDSDKDSNLHKLMKRALQAALAV